MLGLGVLAYTDVGRSAQRQAGGVAFALAALYAAFLALAERRMALIPNGTVLEVIVGTAIILGVTVLFAWDYARRLPVLRVTQAQAVSETLGILIVAAIAAGVPIIVWQVGEIALRLLGHPLASNVCG